MIKFTKEQLLVAIAILTGFALRFASINWGLPLKKAHIDESVVIFYSMRFLTGELNPKIFFDYPTFFLYILSSLFYIVFAAGKIFGIFRSLDQFAGIYLNGDASFIYIIARSLSAILGTASIYLVYRIARENSFKFAAGGAFLFAVLPLNVLHSHYATVDVACVFFVLLSFLFIGRYLRDTAVSHKKDLYRGCFILGLAIATKYYPAVLFVPLVCSIFLKELNQRFKTAILALSVVSAGFIVGCPFSVLDFSAFFKRFSDRFALIIWSGPAQGGVQKSSEFFSALGSAFTMPVLVFLLTGIVLSLIFSIGAKRKNLLWWLSFPCVLSAFIYTWKVVTPHYLLPLIPFACMLGSDGYAMFQKKKFMIPITLLFLTACFLPLASSIRVDKILSVEDTRLTSYKWIKSNLPPGSSILRLACTPEFSNNDPFRVQVDWENKMPGTPAEKLANKFDYIITSHPDNDDPGAWDKSLLKYYNIVKEWENIPLSQFHHPRIIIYGKKT